ncbi:GvpL/GvpF family gas vesicle protein [Streptomyces sp. 4N509B]|uniref:GvpL/GvpF family gas vesicle protein n=1 Tax=Streptomyces sp. 4N509B TaxID=3457413 RepID=UPI003FD022C9
MRNTVSDEARDDVRRDGGTDGGREGPRPQLWYVYAVTRATAAGATVPELRGLDDAPVHTLDDGGLAAVASPVRAEDFAEEPLRAHLSDLDWLERTARGHQRVVDGLLSTGCVLPLRLATVCRDTTGVRRLLTGNRAGLEAAIERLDGCAEWGVTLYADAPATDAAATDADAGVPSSRPPERGTPAAPASGREYLRRRRARARASEDAERRATRTARATHEALSAAAERSRLHPPQDARLSGEPGQNLLNAAYLVRRDQERRFTALAGRLAGGGLGGQRIRLSGPWAPYSFTAAALDEALDGGTGGGTGGGPDGVDGSPQ